MKPSELLADPKAWTKNALARNASGGECTPYAPGAVCWCLEGAMMRCFCSASDERRLSRALNDLGFEKVSFNDSPNTTHADVLRVLKDCGL